jgi:DNA-binding MarR family transcriptional regulator
MNQYDNYFGLQPSPSYSQQLNDKLHMLFRFSKYNEFENQFEKLHGLSVLEISIISTVARHPDIIFREICELFQIPKTTLTSIVNRLEERNYVKRVISKRDKRSFGLELTDDGKLAQTEHFQFQNTVCEWLINALDTVEEKQMLFTLIDKMITNLRE